MKYFPAKALKRVSNSQKYTVKFLFNYLMKHRPIHQNLDTSFVNLSALIKYLRRRQFLGSVKIQLNGYNANIELREDNQMNVREHDQISGRISTGEEALQRLLIRAREPGGTINVFQLVEDEIPNKKAKPPVKQKPESPKREIKTEPILEAEIIEPFSEAIQPKAHQNGHMKNGTPKIKPGEKKGTGTKTNRIKELSKEDLEPILKEKPLPDFPFSLTNKVEEKARQKEISVEEWQTLLKLTVEILGVTDKTLAQANLDFTAAFRKACAEVADDYPFLNPSSGNFDYEKGKIKMTQKVNEKIFVASIMEILRRILEKLESNPKFEKVHRQTSQTLIALMNKRRSQYDKFLITPQIKRILGV